VLGEFPLDLPTQTLNTRAVWLTVPAPLLEVAAIDDADIPGAAAFFKAAKAMVHASQAKIATAKHMANMANPAYAAQYASDRLTADMDRANSNN